MDTSAIDAAMEAAFAAAMQSPQRVLRHWISGTATLQTDTYVAPGGTGFRVVGLIWDTVTVVSVCRVLQHGPDTSSARDWPADIPAELARLGVLFGRRRPA
jgi:hypothetical protein